MSYNSYGEIIEDYEVQHLLGKGGFAIVYKARCRKTNRMVAIKMIDKNLIQGSSMANRVRQEVEIHSRLKHPSVLELYTFFQDAHYVYLVLELAHNGELHRYMQQQMTRPFTEFEAAKILAQVVDGLQYLHSHRIMHRDISLSNLLLSEDMHVKIADFGLATQLRRLDEKHMTMCGTPNYISPEVVSRSSHGLTADVWGVGCMLYTLLVGRPPFDTDAVQSTLTKVVMSDYQIPAYLSIEARDLIHNLLKKNPNERITLEQILRHPFMTSAAGTAAQSTPNIPKYYASTNSDSDSGIVTFASNNSNDSRNTQRIHLGEKSVQPSLCQIKEENVFHKPRLQQDPMNNADIKTLQQFFGNENDWVQRQAVPHITPHIKCNDNHNKNNQNEENAYLSLKKLPSFPQINSTNQNHNPLPQNASEQISVPPLDTKRLLPTRYKTKNAIMSILTNGEVVIEFIKFKSRANEDRITDVCRISKDGQQISIYQPDPGRGLPIRDNPPEQFYSNDEHIYNYNNLPTKHWKKYVYAARFVGLVKSKTPKITYFSPLAKCHLMESLTDFEMCFYSGSKITKSPTHGLKVYNQNGMELNDHSSSTAIPLLEHQTECFRHCLAICTALEATETSTNNCFPVVIGRRPIIENIPNSDAFLRDTTNFAYSTPKSHPGSINFSISTISSTRNDVSSNSSRAQMLASQSNVPIKRISIPTIGTATELSHGVVQIQFYDGSLISIIPETQGGGITYTQPNGMSTHFAVNDDLPILVRDRLTHLPEVERQLKMTPPIGLRKFDANTQQYNQPMKFFR